ncbi:hypothetical protein [Vibrio breoganii]|uniref:hypothetical protein n=1 Tax=Vibrio breoganii TaxID=553239 RepID=UPI0012E9F7A3|nr:hypothetical protein [Vibrio breoganii]
MNQLYIHLIDADSISNTRLKHLCHNICNSSKTIGYIAHNEHCPTRTDIIHNYAKLGITNIPSPKVKNGADFALVFLLGEIFSTHQDKQKKILIHSNDNALTRAIEWACARKFTPCQTLTTPKL